MNPSIFPINSNVLNFNSLAQVIGFKGNNLILKGIGKNSKTGKWLADPVLCQQVSNRHLGFNGVFEYFMINDNMYRSLAKNPISADGTYRLGARFESPPHLIETRLQMLDL